jgi:hypothetical protein
MTPFTMQRMRAEFDQDRGERETARLPTVSAAKVSEVSSQGERSQAYVSGGCRSGTFSRAYGRTSSVWLKSAKPTVAR